MIGRLLFALGLGVASLAALAHDLHHEVSQGQAVVIRLSYADAAPFAFEAYEIYPQDDKLPVQVGRTDARGRIAFLPERAGAWRIKAYSEDGHGLDLTLTTDAAGIVASDQPLYERYGRILVGLGLILGLFGFVSLYLKRRKP